MRLGNLGRFGNVVDTVSGATQDYVESERKRWEETKELGPVGTFTRGLQFGATGPALSINPDGSLDFGPEPFGFINRSASEAAGVDPDEAEESNPLLILVGGLAILSFVAVALGQLFTVKV